MSSSALAAPVPRKLLSPGVYALLLLVAVGLAAGLCRFLCGLQATTNLNQQYPWGIWIVADVSFIALAAGGFATAALAHVFHRTRYGILARPALVLALVGYTSACLVLAADLGRYYNIWHPILPQCWQGNSALFEVGMCVMCYVTVLWVEFLPLICERLSAGARGGEAARWQVWCRRLHGLTERAMFVFIVLGVGISCLHQSSLGNVMVLAGDKLNPLWQTPILALLFLVSAVAAGIPTVMLVQICSCWALRTPPPMAVLSRLARYVPLLLSVYLALKLGDLLIRGAYGELETVSLASTSFLVEVMVGLVAPCGMLLVGEVRRSAGWLAFALALVVIGVVLNRANVYWIGYRPPYAQGMYWPSLVEWLVTLGVAAAAVVVWRAVVIHLPVMTASREAAPE